MVIEHSVEGYTNFINFMKTFESKGQHIHIYFGGSKLPNGKSWCDDCVRAEPHIKKALPAANKDSHFITCLVGDRPTWKDPKCPFRTDNQTKLIVLPTVLRWGGHQRLEGFQCEKVDLLEMLFSDE